jgi:hypothetical protein
VSLERYPLSLVSTIEDLLRRKNCGFGLKPKIRPWGSVVLTRNTLYPQKLALTSPTSGGRSVGRVRLWTKATKLLLVVIMYLYAVPILPKYSSSRKENQEFCLNSDNS